MSSSSPAVPSKVAIIGSGNFGSTAAKIVGINAARLEHLDHEVRMWTFEEEVDGRKLTEIINDQHENVKYLPDIKLPDNVVADPDLISTVKDANMLVFVSPHQFLGKTCQTLKGHVRSDAIAISLIKGMLTDEEENIVLLSDVIRKTLDIPVSVMCGANIANELARENFCETTIGYRDESEGQRWKELFETCYFLVGTVPDPCAVELCGALKNVVAVGAGFCDGLDAGNNSKSAIIRIGLVEMRNFIRLITGEGQVETFMESCGVADLVTTCYGGRNRKVSEAVARTGRSFAELEEEMLNGQKLQGPDTSYYVTKILRRRGVEAEYPLFTAIHNICFEGMAPADLFTALGSTCKL